MPNRAVLAAAAALLAPVGAGTAETPATAPVPACVTVTPVACRVSFGSAQTEPGFRIRADRSCGSAVRYRYLYRAPGRPQPFRLAGSLAPGESFEHCAASPNRSYAFETACLASDPRCRRERPEGVGHEEALLFAKLVRVCQAARAKAPGREALIPGCGWAPENEEAVRQDIRAHVGEACRRLAVRCITGAGAATLAAYAEYSQTLGCASLGHRCQAGPAEPAYPGGDRERIAEVIRRLFPNVEVVVNERTAVVAAECFAKALHGTRYMHYVPRPGVLRTESDLAKWLARQAWRVLRHELAENDRVTYDTVVTAVAAGCMTHYLAAARLGDD